MRLVLDTNILARAATGPASPARELLELALGPDHTLVTSEFLLEELLRVLHYDRLRAIHGWSPEEIRHYVGWLRDGSVVVPIPAGSADAVVLADPDDDPIVATAVLGQADVLCTWDRHFFSSAVQQHFNQIGLRVLRDTDLLQELGKRRAA